MALYEIEIRALGRFDPTPDLVAELGELLEGATGLVDPVVSADLAAGAVELSVEVEAPDRTRAHLTAAEALGAAMVEAGPIAAWSVISPGEIAIV